MGLLATATLLLLGCVPTAQASVYNDVFSLTCANVPRPPGDVCFQMVSQGCDNLEGREGIHPKITRRLHDVASALRTLPGGSGPASVVDDEAQIQSGVKFC